MYFGLLPKTNLKKHFFFFFTCLEIYLFNLLLFWLLFWWLGVDFAAQFIGIEFQKPYFEAQIEVLNGSRKDYPSNDINFAIAESGVKAGNKQELGKKNFGQPRF